MADTDDDVLFQSTVEHENKPHILLLTKCQLSWELHSKCKLQDENILESVGSKYLDLFVKNSVTGAS